jgi:hypothetical protein
MPTSRIGMNGSPCAYSNLRYLYYVLRLQHFCSPAFIAGVTNPIFETSRQWDLFLDISTGNVTVAKDIHTTCPAMATIGLSGPLTSRSSALKAESSVGSEDDITRLAKEGSKADPGRDNADKLFVDDVCRFFFVILFSTSHLTFGRYVRPLKIILAKASSACALLNMSHDS